MPTRKPKPIKKEIETPTTHERKAQTTKELEEEIARRKREAQTSDSNNKD